MKAVIAYCAKNIDGDPVLAPSYFTGGSPQDVRRHLGGIFDPDDWKAGWKIAMKQGWRSQKVLVQETR